MDARWKIFAINQTLSSHSPEVDPQILFDWLSETPSDELDALFNRYEIVVWEPFERLSLEAVAEVIFGLAESAQRTAAPSPKDLAGWLNKEIQLQDLAKYRDLHDAGPEENWEHGRAFGWNDCREFLLKKLNEHPANTPDPFDAEPASAPYDVLAAPLERGSA